VFEGDVIVTGAISAGNIQTGLIRFTPEPGVPTPIEVTGLGLRGDGSVQVQVTAHSAYPGSRVKEISVTSVSKDGFTAWLYRTNGADTNASWLAWRDQ
jgi:hypothetical protein